MTDSKRQSEESEHILYGLMQACTDSLWQSGAETFLELARIQASPKPKPGMYSVLSRESSCLYPLTRQATPTCSFTRETRRKRVNEVRVKAFCSVSRVLTGSVLWRAEVGRRIKEMQRDSSVDCKRHSTFLQCEEGSNSLCARVQQTNASSLTLTNAPSNLRALASDTVFLAKYRRKARMQPSTLYDLGIRLVAFHFATSSFRQTSSLVQHLR